MIFTNFHHPLFRLALTRRALTVALSLALIMVILSTQAPALPRPLGDVVSELNSDFKFWLHSSGWANKLGRLISQSAAAQPERQSDRDARVASIRAFPGDVTINTRAGGFFDAVAYDSKGQQVGGVKFRWRAEDESSKAPVRISQTGEFIPPSPGKYIVTVEGAGKIANFTATVSDAPVATDPNVVEEPGPGWNGGNAGAAQNSDNDRGDPPGRPLHHGAGSGNFQFTAPVLSLPGRGIDLSLALTYNSRVWTVSNSEIIYDIDRDWPAAGWSLGFGRIAGMGMSGSMLIDADGTRHSFAGAATQYPDGHIQFTGHTVDGTFVDYITITDTTQTIVYAEARFPNGTYIQYSSPGRGAVHPVHIKDANGNFVTIQHKVIGANVVGPKILFIRDSLGRIINFWYEGGKLTAITGPGINGGPERQLVRFHYKTLTLNYGFSATLTPNVYDPQPRVLDAIYYPGTGTGYWFGDADSYSPYGMLKKYSEQRGMVFSAASLETEGTVTPGTITRQYSYDYPAAPDTTLTDAPTYSTMTETWDGMDTAAAVTHYLLEKMGATRRTTITFPDQTKSVQLSHRTPGQFKDGYIFEDNTYDVDGTTLLRKSTVTWAQGDYGSARPVRIEAFDELNQVTAAEFVYAPIPSYNQVTEVKDFDYGGTSLLRTTRVAYVNAAEYLNRHIFNLVRRVDVWDAGDTVRMSRIVYAHDEVLLEPATDVVQHDLAYDPYDSEFWDPLTNFRGNVTSVTRYSEAANAPEQTGPGAPDVGGGITETRTYDITGNMVTASTSCCEQMSLGYTLNTQFSLPETQTRGSADPESPARITTNAIYDFNTSLMRYATDANQRQSQTTYFAANLRPQTLTLPTQGYTTYAYDDAAMSVTETANASGGGIASQNVKLLNGLGQVKLEHALGVNSILDYVDTKYDLMGRVWKQSRPHRSGETQQWTETFYDALGRAERVVAPDGSESKSYFNETTRPSTASTQPGQTTRVLDAWGRERWARLDADGRLVEVVEPNPSGNGSVVASGNMVTNHVYDTLGNLTQVNQGQQQRKFRYDSLNRLTHQKLAEESPTLNDSGQYVGTGTGIWSETFTYDERSNLITQTDARGVKTNYSYNSDPLNRLQSVSYDTSGFGDTTHPILAAASVTYEYMTAGDKTRVFKVTAAGVSTDEYGYDSEGRVSSRTLTMTSRTSYPMVTNYIYDTLNRVTDVQYPAQYGVAGNPRKTVHHDYDVSSRLTGLKVGTAEYAKDIVYNAASQTTSLKVGADGANQITESYQFDDTTGLLANQKAQRGVTSLMDLSYEYLRTNTTSGRTGQLTKIINNLDRSKNRGYDYDALGRLVKGTGGKTPSWTQNYVYDRYGNRTSVTATGSTGIPVPQSTIGLYRPENHYFYLRNQNSTGAPDFSVPLGAPGDLPVVGDWDGNGSFTIGVFRPSNSTFYLSNNNTSGTVDRIVSLGDGPNGDLPIVGDWDGDGTWTIGVFRPSANGNAFFLNNGFEPGHVDITVSLGGSGDIPIVGDWDGNGTTTVGLFRPGTNTNEFFLNNGVQSWHVDVIVSGYGAAGDLPIVGDWDGNGTTTIGVYRSNVPAPAFYLRNTNSVGNPDLIIPFGAQGDRPVSGHWTASPSGTPAPRDGLAAVSYDQTTNRINTAGWEYDAAGNQTRVQRSDGTWQRCVYDAAGRLVKVQNDSGITQVIHTYGASNHRLIEQVGNESSNQRTYYAWAGDSVILEYEETPSAATTPKWLKSYVYLGGRLLATIAPNGGSERVEYHHPDRLGTRLVTNNLDTTSFEQVSLPFGTALDAESSGATKRRFTSYDRSSVTGLDYAVNRHYDPLQGRFTQVDPIGMRSASLANPQTLNLYAYCANDPVNHTDPSGLGFFSWLGSIFKKIVAAFVAAVVAVVVVLVTGGNIRAALKAGRDAFRGAFQVYPGWQPSGGWGRTPPTFGSGPTLRQILAQTDLGRRLTPDRRWFLTPGIAGNGFAAQSSSDGKHPCAAMASRAEMLANDAIKQAGGADSYALELFDRAFSQAYLGNNGIGTGLFSAIAFFLKDIKPKVPIAELGEEDFKTEFQDHEGEQTHHFAAFLSAGINGQNLPAMLHMGTDFNNKADRNLGWKAYGFGSALQEDPFFLRVAGKYISKYICK